MEKKKRRGRKEGIEDGKRRAKKRCTLVDLAEFNTQRLLQSVKKRYALKGFREINLKQLSLKDNNKRRRRTGERGGGWDLIVGVRNLDLGRSTNVHCDF